MSQAPSFPPSSLQNPLLMSQPLQPTFFQSPLPASQFKNSLQSPAAFHSASWSTLSLPQLRQTLSSLSALMLQEQSLTNYSNAEHYRILHEKCQAYTREREKNQIKDRYQQEENAIEKRRKEQIMENGKELARKREENKLRFQNGLEGIVRKFEAELALMRKEKGEQLSNTPKQSTQLINLRQMQIHANKQKNFVQAHSIQQKIKALYSKQLSAWNDQKQRILTAMQRNLRRKYETQKQNLIRRYKLQCEDNAKDLHQRQLQINQRYNKELKQLRDRGCKEMLGVNLQLKNLGGKVMPKTREKQKSAQMGSQDKSDFENT